MIYRQRYFLFPFAPLCPDRRPRVNPFHRLSRFYSIRVFIPQLTYALISTRADFSAFKIAEKQAVARNQRTKFRTLIYLTNPLNLSATSHFTFGISSVGWPAPSSLRHRAER